MIARAKSIAHGGAGINYALEKDGAEIIDKRFVVGDTGAEIKGEFRIFQNLNSRAKNNDLSFVLSPDPKDGQRLSNEDFKAISDNFLKKMNLENHQAISVKHTDRDHAHLHLFVNRIDSNGKAYKDSWISKESQTRADQVAREMGLTRARSVEAARKEMTLELRNQIFEKHTAVLRKRPRDFRAYREQMKSKGVEILPTINKSNRLQGFRVEFQGLNLKATQVHETMSLSKMGVKIAKIGMNHNPGIKGGMDMGISR